MATELKAEIEYPSRDGKPMADNTLQWEWIATIKLGLEAVFRDRPDVFVAGDLLWYPVEGEPQTNAAPDAMVVFGRPKGHRMSYKQWEEGGIGPQVVFEVLSHSNDPWEMADKLYFYAEHGVDEYYIYDPYKIDLRGFRRVGSELRRITPIKGFTSPRLGVRFEVTNTLELFGPDGRKFATYLELIERSERADAEIERLRALLRNRGIDPNAANGHG